MKRQYLLWLILMVLGSSFFVALASYAADPTYLGGGVIPTVQNRMEFVDDATTGSQGLVTMSATAPTTFGAALSRIPLFYAECWITFHSTTATDLARFRGDGTAPTSSTGHVAPVNTIIKFVNVDMSNFSTAKDSAAKGTMQMDFTFFKQEGQDDE